MAFKVQVGPAQIAIHQGRTVLVCEPDGTIPFPSEKGLYFNDTRIISSWSLYADGVRWDLLSGGATGHDRSSIHLTNRKLVTASGPVAARTLGMVLTRSMRIPMKPLGYTDLKPPMVPISNRPGWYCLVGRLRHLTRAKSGSSNRRQRVRIGC